MNLAEPSLIAGGLPCPHGRPGDGLRLDRLLVEARPRLTPLPSPHRSKAEMLVARLDFDQPRQQSEPVVDHPAVVERRPSGDERLGEHAVGVGETLLRPGP